MGAILIVVLLAGLFFIPAPEKKSQVEDGYTFFEEKTNLAEIIVEYPSLGYEKADAALDAVIDTFVEDFRSATKELGESPTGRPYVFVIEDQKVVESAETIGILLLVYQDFGGAHGLPQLIGLNFNKETGEEISLDNVLDVIDQDLQSLSEGAKAHFTEILGESLFVEGTEAKEENFMSFILEENEVTFYFQPYQVAAYALGPQEYKISY